jgi:predicted P-loop ATPase
MAYARFPVERPRQFIIIGTTNNKVYLADSTGARRFWPIEVRRFDVEWIRSNRDQLWAEAAHREAAGEAIRLSEELWPDAAVEQEKRREPDAWEDSIRVHSLSLTPSLDGRLRVATQELYEVLQIDIARRDRVAAIRIGEAMQRLGFRRTTMRVGGIVCAGYVHDEPSALQLSDEGAEGETLDADIPF